MTTEKTIPRHFRVEKQAAPLRQRVTASIRDAIAVGWFRAGEWLPERRLCEMTGVSRTLVREALRQLESEGLIELVPHRGPTVVRLTPRQAEGIYQVRARLEGLATELFAQYATEEQRAALRAEFGRLRSSFDDEDPVTRLSAKNRFYERIIEGSGNEALGDTLRILNSRVTVLRATSLQAEGRAAASLAELEALVEALCAGDAEAARQAAERHVFNAGQTAIARLREQEGECAEAE